MPFRVATRQQADFVVVSVIGAVDTQTAAPFGQHLFAALEQCSRVVCDISAVEFFDSAGLSVLIDSRNRAVLVGSSIELVCTNSSMLKLFSITGLDTLFVVHRTLGDAMQTAAVQV